MSTPLSWKNLRHRPMRTLVAVAGVSFAVLLVFVQLGFRGAVEATATAIYDKLEFDLLLRPRDYLHFAEPQSFPWEQASVAAGHEDVQWLRPLLVTVNQWRNPQTGATRGMLILGVRPSEPVFRSPENAALMRRLTAPQYVLVDRRSRPEFGPADGQQFSAADIGVETEVAGHGVRIVGHFALGSGLAADGTAIVNQEGFHRVAPYQSRRAANLGLIKLRDGADAEVAAAAIRARLPQNLEVLTRDEVVAYETRRWVQETSIGLIFGLGVAVSLVVGVAIVYQVLASDVARHLAEYATLKAIGYSNHFLSSVVIGQSLLLALLGFIPAVLLSYAFYEVTSSAAGIPIFMTIDRLIFVLIATLIMCTFSAVGALRRVYRLDPAELF